MSPTVRSHPSGFPRRIARRDPPGAVIPAVAATVSFFSRSWASRCTKRTRQAVPDSAARGVCSNALLQEAMLRGSGPARRPSHHGHRFGRTIGSCLHSARVRRWRRGASCSRRAANRCRRAAATVRASACACAGSHHRGRRCRHWCAGCSTPQRRCRSPGWPAVSHRSRLRCGSTVACRSGSAGRCCGRSFGVSGPAALDASRHWTRAGADGHDVRLTLSFCPSSTFESVDGPAARRCCGRGRVAALATLLSSILPSSVADAADDGGGIGRAAQAAC